MVQLNCTTPLDPAYHPYWTYVPPWNAQCVKGRTHTLPETCYSVSILLARYGCYVSHHSQTATPWTSGHRQKCRQCWEHLPQLKHRKLLARTWTRKVTTRNAPINCDRRNRAKKRFQHRFSTCFALAFTRLVRVWLRHKITMVSQYKSLFKITSQHLGIITCHRFYRTVGTSSGRTDMNSLRSRKTLIFDTHSLNIELLQSHISPQSSLLQTKSYLFNSRIVLRKQSESQSLSKYKRHTTPRILTWNKTGNVRAPLRCFRVTIVGVEKQ